MPKLRLRREAEDDLRRIGRYTLQQWGPEQRNRYLRALNSRLREVATHPKLGARRDALRPGYRSVRQGRHLIFYREIEDGVEVVRILHESMDIARHLGSAPQHPVDEKGR